MEGKVFVSGWQESVAGSCYIGYSIYTMSVFQLLPKSLCSSINSMMARFLWGHKDNVSNLAWMS